MAGFPVRIKREQQEALAGSILPSECFLAAATKYCSEQIIRIKARSIIKSKGRLISRSAKDSRLEENSIIYSYPTEFCVHLLNMQLHRWGNDNDVELVGR
ncbi:hypothetical protein FQA39_LY02329 [Lamprigera yunnana]|nr:hypothetical protein FQA39_LY02329 [Lamprigera yunnana]